MRKTIIFILLLLGLSSCLFDVKTMGSFMVINYSDETQMLYFCKADTFESNKDSLNYAIYSNYNYARIAKDYSQMMCKVKNKGWRSITIDENNENLFSGSKDGRVRFYFISDSVFMKYSWDTIVKHQMYNKKLTYTEKQMDSVDWIIEYR